MASVAALRQKIRGWENAKERGESERLNLSQTDKNRQEPGLRMR